MRQAWKLAIAAVVTASLAGCANDDRGGGGGNDAQRDTTTSENSNPVTSEQDNAQGSLPLNAEPESGTGVKGRVADNQVRGGQSTVIAHGGQASRKVDVNAASVEQLKEVPGISDTMARAIVNNRPYRDEHDLLRRVPNLDKRQLAAFDEYLIIGAPREKGAGVPMEN